MTHLDGMDYLRNLEKNQSMKRDPSSFENASACTRKFLTNIKLKGINKSIHKRHKGGGKNMACGMKHPKAKKTTKKATKKKKESAKSVELGLWI